MRILINHLTRMHGGHICVAGVDLETRRHVRPMLPGEMLPFYMLARYGGPFEMSWVVDLGRPRPLPEPPHVEDHVFIASRTKADRPAAAHELWGMLEELRQPSLRRIFGADLHNTGRNRLAAELGQGTASLGFLRPAAPPELYLANSADGRPRIRMRFSDGEFEADAGVTDLRLYGDDHATPDSARVCGLARAIAGSRNVILAVGLTRKFRVCQSAPYRHWLQVNNVHLPEIPIWRLG